MIQPEGAAHGAGHAARTRRRGAPRGALLLALLAGLAGCASSADEPEGEPSPFVPLPDPEPDSIGFFLTEFDASVRAWTNLVLAGRTERDRRMLRGLEKEMAQRAARRRDELLDELEGGPPTNRAVAAVALGFTGDPGVMSPLYDALSDQDGDVVHSALLGLGKLGDPSTPPAEICYLLRNDPDPWIRNNAAYALQSIVSAGAPASALVVRSCREALLDDEAGVRAQCAVVLGQAVVADAVDELGDMLYDEKELPAAAAASALARIGREHLESKGRCARLLADGLDRVDEERRPVLLRELEVLSEASLGDEAEPWREWAYKLP